MKSKTFLAALAGAVALAAGSGAAFAESAFSAGDRLFGAPEHLAQTCTSKLLTQACYTSGTTKYTVCISKRIQQANPTKYVLGACSTNPSL